MADHEINIVVKGKNQTGSTFSSLSQSITGINQALEIAMKVAQALKQAYDTAKEGASLLYAEERFDSLAKSIGTTADVLMKDLRDATHGMVSDAELMASAGDFMSLGLAKTHDEAVRLSTVAGALGMNMNQLVLTLTNQTTMRFDALGVSVAGFDEKVKALEASGMSASEAFTEAFLQQAEEQIKRVGDQTDSTIGDFKRLEAAMQNLGNSVKQDIVLPFVQGAIPAITGFINALNQLQSVGGEVKGGLFDDFFDGITEMVMGFTLVTLAAEAMEKKLIDGKTYLKLWGQGATGAFWDAEKLQEGIDYLSEILGYNTGEVEENGDTIVATSNKSAAAIIEQSIATEIAEKANGQWGESLVDVEKSMQAAQKAAEEYGKALESAFNTIAGAAVTYGGYQKDLDEQKQSLEELQAIINNPLTGGYFEGVYYSVEDASEALKNMGEVSSQTFSEFGADGEKMKTDFEAKVKRLNDIATSTGGGWFDGVWISVDGAKDKMDEINGKIDEIEAKMKSAAAAIVWDMTVASFDFTSATETDLAGLFNTGIALGVFTKESLFGLSGDVKETLHTNGLEATGFIDTVLAAIGKLPAGIDIPINMSLSETDDIDRYLNELTRGITIPVNIGGVTLPGKIPDAAGGAVQPAAAGVSGLSSYYVGEIGPELFFPAQNGRIVSNSEAKASLRSGRGGGETIVVNINTPMNFADKAWVERELAPYIQKGIREAAIRG
jgi:hypothetical protein